MVVGVSAQRLGNWAALSIGALMSDSFSYVGHWDPQGNSFSFADYIFSDKALILCIANSWCRCGDCLPLIWLHRCERATGAGE